MKDRLTNDRGTDSVIGNDLASAPEPLTMVLYGREGSAKTTEALGLARLGKVVAIDAEGGMKPTPLRQRGIPVENVDVWPPNGDTSLITFANIEEQVFIPMKNELDAARAAGEPDPYVGVSLDSFTELSALLLKEASAENEARDAAKGKNRARFQVNIEDYGTSSQMMRQLLRMFRSLGIHLVITALERREQDEQTGFVNYGPAISPAIANDVLGMADVVIWTQAEELGPNATPFFTGTTRPRELHRAKDRYGVLPVRMIEPSADRVLEYIRGAMTKATDDRHKAAVAASQPPAE